ncbi:MAG: molybdopterin-dependent oxidoreductase, partial [Candidatus Omnitrophica bacterium]|nr:molybdopterin-dependent oxidoreductase [Candidatus Omnitrophota bacterium]
HWGEERELSFEEFKGFLEDYKPQDVERVTGVGKEKIIMATRLFAESKATMSLWTMGLNQRKWGTWANNLMYNLHLLTGKICKPGSTALSMTGQPNACGGVREQGMLSHVLPGHRSVKNPGHRREMEEIWGVPSGSISEKPGLHTVKMFDELGGKIKLIWIACSNPAQTLPDLNKYLPKFKKAFVIVQDIFPPTQVQKNEFPNITAEYADIFLPSAFWIEKGGVFGNTERRSSLTEKMIDPPHGLKSDGDIFIEVARRMGYGKFFQYPDMESVWDEYIHSTRGTDLDLSGASYSYLRNNGSAQWPILSESEGGSERRYQYPEDKYLKSLFDSGKAQIDNDGVYFYGFKDGRAKIFKRPHNEPAEKPDEHYPFYLTTGRVVHHWHTGTMTMRVPWFKKMVKEAFVEVNIEDTKKINIRNGDKVRIISRRGEVILKAKTVDTKTNRIKGIEERLSIPRPGVVFVPFFDPLRLINLVCIDAVDDMSKEPEYKICAVRIEKV